MSQERCSFCERSLGQVNKLISSARATICDRCVDAAHEYVEGITTKPQAMDRPCTFCGKSEARSWYAGARAVICEACITLSVDILVENRRTVLPNARVIRS